MNETQKSLYEAIEILIDEKLKNLKYNYTKDGVVKSVSGNKAVVTIDEVDSTCGIRSGLALYPNDLVKVMINKNDYSDKYVDVKLMQINENPTPNSDDIADAVEKKHDSAIVDGHRISISATEPTNPAYLDVWIDISE